MRANSAVTPGLVSVVVASYNHAEYLTRRMESLIGQTYPSIEILVIDDCSRDNSVEVLRRYETDPRTRMLLRDANGGWVAVFNQGLELSSGEFVIFANCDDDCDPRMIERLVDSMGRNPDAGIAFCRSLMIDDADRVMGDDFRVRERSFQRKCAADTFIAREEMRRFLLHSCVIPNMSAALIRRECFRRVGAFSYNYRACSDWELFFKTAECFDFAYVAEPLNRFRQHHTTVRSATKGRVTTNEFIRLLLGEVRHGRLSLRDRTRGRYRVMYLCAMDLLRPAIAGIGSFRHHLVQIVRLDPVALLFLVPAIVKRSIELPVKAVGKAVRLVWSSGHTQA